MPHSTGGVLFWSPRILALIFVVFVSMFALDVFEEDLGFWGTTGALLLHLIPSALLGACLAIAWTREWVGALAFGALGVVHVALMWDRFPNAVMATPVLVIAALFLAGWLRGSPESTS